MHRQRFGIVLTDRERAALDRLAEAEGGLSRSALLRRLLRQAALQQGLWPAEHEQSNNRKEGSA